MLFNRTNLSRRTPFFYGWVVFAIASTLSLVRPVMAVATLSVFVVPMTSHFGWSRGSFSAAVSAGGLAGAIIAPYSGRLLDRYGSGHVLAIGSFVTGLCAIGLSLVTGPISFALAYIIGRMTYVGPMELAPSTAVSNWFVRKRALAMAFMQASQGIGLGLMPFIAQLAIANWGWRSSWQMLGIIILTAGILPPLLFMLRRPEDVGLSPDGDANRSGNIPDQARQDPFKYDFTLRQAVKTKTMWMLMAFSALMFMVQAGVSLHQAPYHIHQGMGATQAATIVTVFAFSSAIGGLFWSALIVKVPLRLVITTAAFTQFSGVIAIMNSHGSMSGYIAALIFGMGLGGVAALIRLIWAEYYGRRHLGVIRGVALPAQITGQAMGPILAGVFFDFTGNYMTAWTMFAVSAAIGTLLISLSKPPRLIP
ncbi:MFS transporter [SAR202 cluster bacterium AD-804-J14_MRT_500m]|nr:MFS transporter [SAR202 cluster bacterium AD-804-J14_MRT_500m]